MVNILYNIHSHDSEIIPIDSLVFIKYNQLNVLCLILMSHLLCSFVYTFLQKQFQKKKFLMAL